MRRNTALLVVAGLSAILAIRAEATRQVREKVIWSGRTYAAEEYPLVFGFFDDDAVPHFASESTANYKGYRAVWEVRDNRIFLKELTGRIDAAEITLEDLFPDKSGPIEADWFSGIVILSDGKDLGFSRMYGRHLSSKEIHLWFFEGKLYETNHVKNKWRETPMDELFPELRTNKGIQKIDL